MLPQRLSNIVFIVLILVASAYLAVVAQGFEAAGLLASSGLPSKFFPQLLLGFIAVCSIGVVVSYLRGDPSLEAEPDYVYQEPTYALRGLLTLASVLIGYGIWRYWGYVPMMVFIGAATCLSMGARNPVIYAVVYALFALIYVVFTQLLGTQF